MRLSQGGKGVAVIAGVASEALAQTGRVVTLSTAAALVGVSICDLRFTDVGRSTTHAGLKSQAIDLRCAAVATLIVFHLDQVLLTLNGISSESDLDIHRVATNSLTSNGQGIDNSVRQIQQSEVNIVCEIGDIRVIKHDRNSCEGLVKSRGKCKCEGARVEIVITEVTGLEVEPLHLVFLSNRQGVTDIKDVVSMRTHSLGAINIAICSITNTTAGLASIPSVVVVRQLTAHKVQERIIIPICCKSHVFNIFACSVTRTVIGAGSTLA
mmetsp:Transcript_8047/g.15772  ORF Transcript_8047/g.15772 Transcript_8047/m.15772 type:complete len:268 (-) Transcript_8047:323-1126(-)